jgi:hypothetical protein
MSQKLRDAMPNLKLEETRKFVKVYVIAEHYEPRFIGTIDKMEKKLLIILDDLTAHETNYHKLSKSLGIDRLALESKDIQYNTIEIVYDDERYITTRWYFYSHHKSYQLQSSIDMLFLRTDLFGWKRAIDWEKYFEHEKIAQMNIFEVFELDNYTDDNNRNLRKYEKALKFVEEYENKNYRKVDL